jgi:hypothetical protein
MIIIYYKYTYKLLVFIINHTTRYSIICATIFNVKVNIFNQSPKTLFSKLKLFYNIGC